MRALLVCTLLLPACNFDQSTVAGSGDGAVADADPNSPDADPNAPDADPNAPDADPNAPDAMPVAPCADWARTPSLFDPCLDITMESDSLSLTLTGRYTYDTDSGSLRSPFFTSVSHTSIVLGAGSEAPRVIIAGSFEIGPSSSLLATGGRPILIVSWNDIVINGDIDAVGIDVVTSASFTGASFPGAGANSSLCPTAENGTSATDGGGGGAGAGFATPGGNGGNGRNGDNAGGTGGAALTQAFHGGCPGGDGGVGDGDASDIGLGGRGGGAVYLNARNTLSISGEINAGGQGGLGALGAKAAGGGGGSGGHIGLEAATLNLLSGAIVAANGGGGGGGGKENASEPGEDGQPDGSFAAGGLGEASGNPRGDGGNGGFVGLAIGQVGEIGERGGGGGGGGVGYIVFSANSTTNNAAEVSPAETTIP